MAVLATLCIVLGAGAGLSAMAQTDSTQTQGQAPQRWLVETKDGNTIQGVYLGQSEGNIRLLTQSTG
ncbi:hypothetical protein POKO110462_05530 [Pontibacter korlensis]|uniref:Uncharacterized protein n=1 Tax=Pontibacter korlensis TaxID=400092 RepID=A0A0E3UX95_9BACT|nr:hypothetical protein PKOR_10100 [Pontibacter korlensis]